MARISAVFHTPLREVLAMPWDQILLWWAEARDIHAETWGRLPAQRNGGD